MRIQHNIAALNSYRQLGGNNNAVGKNLEKLSSGYKINRAGDDAAGLAISEKMRAQIKGLETAQNNANDGISLVQTAEGALTEVHSMLNRMSELATQSSNGTYDNDVDRKSLQEEIKSLKSEIDRISESTNYNGINLLDGSLGSSSATGVAVNVKYADLASNPDVLKLNAATATTSTVAAEGTSPATLTKGDTYNVTLTYRDADGALQETTVDFTAADDAEFSDSKNDASNTELQEKLQEKLGDGYTVGVASGEITITSKNAGAADQFEIYKIGVTDSTGTDQAVFDAPATTAGEDAYYDLNADKIDVYSAGGDASKSIFEINGQKFAFVEDSDAAADLDSDVNYVKVTSGSYTVGTDDVAMAALISEKTGINASASSSAISLKAGTASATSGDGLVLQVGDTADKYNKVTVSVGDMSSSALGIGGVDIGSQTGASAALEKIKDAINKVSAARGGLGAVQNRLEHTINNLGVAGENMTAAESRIRDVDMAKEMMDFTKNNILTQSAQAMLAQANQIPQGVLQLLQ
ncbi:flagellin [Sinanaerobacter sp. ZZT-01]|uniref:flagellin N-terminal helical domain-containing protein n=1 Tax=Sinanaerobacter sp. ZZT-01 TaxID=3111540 RepID=UPI002D78BB90|nr:flagellin [Sinanaerobacter sp. ZZT-01]WRR94298.1 flagellin [Sinanaerobacter sp. ZZT-01]